MSGLRIISILVFALSTYLLPGQNLKRIEELKKEIAAGKEDSSKVKKLISLSLKLSNYEFKNAINYAIEANELAKKVNYVQGEIDANNCLADAYWFHSDYDKAQQYYFKAYRIADSIHDDRAIAFSLYNIGWIICIQQHNYDDNKYLYKSLGIYERIKDTTGLLSIYNAMASYYTDRFKQEEKRQYFDSSIRYFNKGIDIAKTTGNYSSNLGRIYGNLGDLFYIQGDYKSAEFYNKKSLEIHQKTQDSSSMAICLLNMGLCDLETNNLDRAITQFKTVYDYNKRHDITDVQQGVLLGLSRAYYMKGEYKQAYDYHDDYVKLKEKLDKEAYSTNISNLQSSYSLEKSEADVKQLKQTNEIQELKNKKNTYFIFALLGVALVVLVVAGLLFKQNKQKQLTNTQLQLQNNIIAEKKQEIDNSIQYAKGIQQAILPNVTELSNYFEQSFIFYKPKDVVSGDFYWFSKVGDSFYCIAADCTGHGVPGALMSIIGADKISQAIYEKNIASPGEILSYLNTQIRQVLKQHSDESKQKDGMDIALLKFNTGNKELEYAGANRPLYIVRDQQLIEYKADKTAIAGFTPDEQVYVTTKVSLQTNDSIYIFTDGYADQFGGAEGKKFMTKNLKQLLVEVAGLDASRQQEKIISAFNNWKKDYEQVDDVLIIGVRI